MYKKGFTLLAFVFLLVFVSCLPKTDPENKEFLVLIETSEGPIKIKLYQETPQHRDNFIKLVRESYYNGTLFHRVINEFMIQGGDPDSRLSKPGEVLGNGGPGYTVPAEFQPKLFHKKGALAAARERDKVNPQRRSSGSQFYLVQGKVFTDDGLDKMELRINDMLKQAAFFRFIEEEKVIALGKGQEVDMAKIQEAASLRAEVEFINMQPYKIPLEQREVYKTLGGTPHLDQNYTVFGEIVEGLGVLDKISATEVDDKNRPVKDIKIVSM
ncbi:MAG: peptidylprolyl isomerase, partial [Bacteroidota bacterium]|nr:peptidylprolyl isomerase [Bacteroidota bacterium]